MWQAPAARRVGSSLIVMTRHTRCVVTVRPAGLSPRAGRGAYRIQFANRMDMAPSLRELIALTLLAGLGCGLALAHGDLLFVAVFGGAIAMTIETIRRFP